MTERQVGIQDYESNRNDDELGLCNVDIFMEQYVSSVENVKLVGEENLLLSSLGKTAPPHFFGARLERLVHDPANRIILVHTYCIEKVLVRWTDQSMWIVRQTTRLQTIKAVRYPIFM